jgi:thioredoxin-related protein
MKTIRRTLALIVILLASAACMAAADTPQPADQVLAAAESAAAAQHKNVWVIFGASWCGWCHKLDALINSPDAGPMLQQHFAIAHVTVDEHGDKASLDNPGGDKLRKRLGGSDNSGLPFFAFLDPAGQVIVNSNRPVPGKPGENIGFPSAPEEVDWFMTMLRRAAPSLGAEQTRMIEARLRSKS